MMTPRNFDPESTRGLISRATGPTSEAGKHIISFNSTKHNLTSTGKDRAALPGEEDAFEQFCSEMRHALAPVGVMEGALADDIAADRFRVRRARKMEHALFAKIERESRDAADAPTAKAEAWIDASKGLQRLALYANRLQRAIEKNTVRLEAMQTERKAAEAKAREEAILLTRHAESKGETYDPGRDFTPASDHGGFVYSRDEIVASIGRSRRLEEAKLCLDATAGTLPAAA
jgi:hypothetical protein